MSWRCLRLGSVMAAALMSVGAMREVHSQSILQDTFEDGADGDNVRGFVDGGIWGRTGFAAATPKYAAANNPFGGALYLDFNNPALAGDDTILTSSDATDSRGIGPSITNKVTTFSFNFWESLTPESAGLGTSFGYSVSNDLNAANRVWRASIRNGTLTPDGVAEGAAAAYPTETVNTIWMMGNDTTADVVNYAGGRTLVAKRADVWLAINGGAPTFAFSINRQNPAAVIRGMGFRGFSSDAGHILLDDVLLLSGASLDRSAIGQKPGDVDGDDDVDLDDFAAIRDHFQKLVTLRTDGDLTHDGVVDFLDYRQWKTFASAEAVSVASSRGVPEPAGAVLAGLGMAALVWRRGRQFCPMG